MFYRGTNSGEEYRIFMETEGHLLSDATKRLCQENGGKLDMAYEQSVPIHDNWLDIWWGSENYFAQAHAEFGTEMPSAFDLRRTLMSVTTDIREAERFANGGYIFEVDIPRSQLIEQTLSDAGESEYLIRFGAGGFRIR